jgi:hypothetical protein
MGGGGVVEMRGRVGEEVSKCKNTLMPSSAARRDFFQIKVFFLMMRVDSPLLNQSASGLNFYVNIGCSLLADAIR